VIVMTSTKQLSANKKNGARSRGPRPAAGKARSSGNALRHGLTVNLLNDPSARAEAESLALTIADPNTSRARLAQTMTVAEAQLDLLRIRGAQVRLLDSAYCASAVPGGGEAALSAEALPEVMPQFIRWHVTMNARSCRGSSGPSAVFIQNFNESLSQKKEAPHTQ
jgi:hypothetical protein